MRIRILRRYHCWFGGIIELSAPLVSYLPTHKNHTKWCMGNDKYHHTIMKQLREKLNGN